MRYYARSLKNKADQGIVIDAETGKDVAVTYTDKDAPLLAAAPSLLDACKAMLEDLRHFPESAGFDSCAMAEYAIAQAEEEVV